MEGLIFGILRYVKTLFQLFVSVEQFSSPFSR